MNAAPACPALIGTAANGQRFNAQVVSENQQHVWSGTGQPGKCRKTQSNGQTREFVLHS